VPGTDGLTAVELSRHDQKSADMEPLFPTILEGLFEGSAAENDDFSRLFESSRDGR
jgi:hypothetical protein